MAKLLRKIFGDGNQRQLNRIQKTVDQIEMLESKFEAYSDEELQTMTEQFKERYENGEQLEDMLVEAYAVVREASKRALNMRPFPVQLVGATVLHEGNIAEMKTGEGKTLSSTMPAYLNAITGKGVHIITVNEYLANRGAEEMGKLYEFLGLSVGLNISGMTKEEKKEAYDCDITYGTNNEFGFDYLRDNMVLYKEQMVQRELNYAIIDEVYSILIEDRKSTRLNSTHVAISYAVFCL